MTERPAGAAHLQISKLLMIVVVIAVAATGALLVTLAVGNGPPGGGGGGSNPNGMPPPPPDSASTALTVITGLFVLAWLAVLVVFSRDQILLRLRQQQPVTGPGGVSREELTGLLADLRAELASDRERDNDALSERLAELTAEYGERRETDGYLSGMRMATTDDPSAGNVRSLRRPPPQR
jgi:preprotein translocase subunit SecG